MEFSLLGEVSLCIYTASETVQWFPQTCEWRTIRKTCFSVYLLTLFLQKSKSYTMDQIILQNFLLTEYTFGRLYSKQGAYFGSKHCTFFYMFSLRNFRNDEWLWLFTCKKGLTYWSKNSWLSLMLWIYTFWKAARTLFQERVSFPHILIIYYAEKPLPFWRNVCSYFWALFH